jgi:hypothetical protein
MSLLPRSCTVCWPRCRYRPAAHNTCVDGPGDCGLGCSRQLTAAAKAAILRPGRVSLPVGRAGFKPVGRRAGAFGRFDSFLFRLSNIYFSSLRNYSTKTSTVPTSLIAMGRRTRGALDIMASYATARGVAARDHRHGRLTRPRRSLAAVDGTSAQRNPPPVRHPRNRSRRHH